MKRTHSILPIIAILLAAILMSSCSRTSDLPISDSGEEDNTEFALDEQYDKVRAGARLILTYDAQTNSFKGTVENTTNETLKQVRVEVHLSNGIELGPTTPGDLAPGETRDIVLIATSTDFNGWTAHPEVGGGGGGESGESGHSGESGEHAGEQGNEHN